MFSIYPLIDSLPSKKVFGLYSLKLLRGRSFPDIGTDVGVLLLDPRTYLQHACVYVFQVLEQRQVWVFQILERVWVLIVLRTDFPIVVYTYFHSCRPFLLLRAFLITRLSDLSGLSFYIVAQKIGSKKDLFLILT